MHLKGVGVQGFFIVAPNFARMPIAYALSLAALSLAALAPALGHGGGGGGGSDAWGEADAGSGAECRAGMEPLIRAGANTPACVTPESKSVLIGRGWGSDPPTHQAVSHAPPSRPAPVPAHLLEAPVGMTPTEKAWLDENPVIRVVYDNRPPIEHADDDGDLLGLSGMHLDYLEEFTDVDFILVPASSRTGLANALLTGEAHMALAMGNADQLYHHGITFHPHTAMVWDMVALDRTVVTPRDVQLGLGAIHEHNFTIGTIRGYEIETWIDAHYPHIPYISIDSHERAFDALESGRIDILIEAWEVVTHIAESRGLDNLHHLGSVGPEMPLSIAFNKNHSVLEDIIKKALDAMPDDVRSVSTAEILGEPPASRRFRTADPLHDVDRVQHGAGFVPRSTFAGIMGISTAAAAANGGAAAAANGGAAAAANGGADAAANGGAASSSDRLTAPLPQLSDMERAWLDDNPVVRFVYMDWPPIEYTDGDGKVTGLSAMYIERLESFTGAKFVATPVDSWTTAFSLVAEGGPYVSLSMSPNTHSFGHIVSTTPHLAIELNLVTKGPINASHANLHGFKVGTIRGSAVESWLDLNRPQIDYMSIDTHEHALDALDAGRIDVLLEYWPAAERLAAEGGIAGLHNSGKMDYEVVLSAGTSKQNPLLNDILRKAIYSIPVEERISMLAAALDAGLH